MVICRLNRQIKVGMQKRLTAVWWVGKLKVFKLQIECKMEVKRTVGETTTLTSAYTNNDELIHATSFFDEGKCSRDKGNECAATASNVKSLIANCKFVTRSET